jgi:hypothetical protein
MIVRLVTVLMLAEYMNRPSRSAAIHRCLRYALKLGLERLPAEEVSMPRRTNVSLCIIVALFAVVSVSAQQRTPAKAKAARTPWGEPDLQGTWLNATITPFERPATLADKPFLTAEEAALQEKQAAERRVDRVPKPGEVGAYNDFWTDSGTKVVSTRQTSLVIEPPDGRVPLKPSAEQQRDFNVNSTDTFEFMSPWDRCITRGIPGAMFPAGYNNAYQILQIPGYVVIYYEMIHSARVIPVNGRAHLPAHMRSFDGDSVGHWEGDTLVVDITNFNGRGWIATNAASGRIRGVPQSDALHVVERFTRTDADTIGYEVTIDDPNVYTRPWKVSIPLGRDNDYKIFEYACHEGNHAIPNILSGARALDRTAAQETTQK